MKQQLIIQMLRAGRPDLANAVAHVVEAGQKLDNKLRQKVNRDLDKAGFGGNGRFRSIGQALNKIAQILETHGIQQDDTFDANLFREPQGNRTFHVAFGNPEDPFSPASIGNSLLVIQWYVHPTKAIEVLAYLS